MPPKPTRPGKHQRPPSDSDDAEDLAHLYGMAEGGVQPRARRGHLSEEQRQRRPRGAEATIADVDMSDEEGEDLFDEAALARDYGEGGNVDGSVGDESVSSAGLGSFIASDGDANDGGGAFGDDVAQRRHVERLLERRDRLAQAMADDEERRIRALDHGGAAAADEDDADAAEQQRHAALFGDSDGSADSSRSDDDVMDAGISGFPSTNTPSRRPRRHGDGVAPTDSGTAMFDADTATMLSGNRAPRSDRGDESLVGAGADPEGAIFCDGEIQPQFDWAPPPGAAFPDWIAQDGPRRVVLNRVYNFLLNFVPAAGAERVYPQRVLHMVRDNGESFEVSYLHLARVYGGRLAAWLGNYPEIIIDLINEAAAHLVFKRLFADYKSVHKDISVRIVEMPMRDPIRDFRQIHRDVLACVEGVVVRRSPVYPQLRAVRFNCGRCSFVIGPVMQRGDKEAKVTQCPACMSRGPFRVNMALTEYRNHQTLVLQETPGSVPPGRLPRSLEVVVTGDLIDRARPGEQIDVTGIYKNTFDPVANHRQGFPIFQVVLVANNVERRTVDAAARRLPEEDRRKIVQLARHPRVKEKVIASVAPSIHGREDIKLGLLLSLLGGVPKSAGEGHRIRGDINVLLMGDPGTAKSQCLKFVEKTADRAVFTTGRGSTAVGLTASVQRDPVSGDFALEGGALVIADRGTCLIDEFDKMSDQDRTSIHEAMEQQTISVARGGIVTTLSARCAVVAAANPIGGRYDPSVSFDANVDLTPPILSRFDLLFVLRDEVDATEDLRLARFVCHSHMASHPQAVAAALERTRKLQQTLMEATNKRADVADVIFRLAQRLHSLESTSAMGLNERGASGSGDDLVSDSSVGGGADLHIIKAEIESQEAVLRTLDEQISATETRLARGDRDADDTAPGGDDGPREDEDPNSPLPLPQSLLRQYIQYARGQVRPLLVNVETDAITSLYRELRQESKQGGIPITVRHMESVIRLAEAHARLHLRDFVSSADVDAAVALFLRCFLGTQKYAARSQLESKFRRYTELGVEPRRLLHSRVSQLARHARALERQLSGGIEPTVAVVDAAEVDAAAAQLNVLPGAVHQYYESEMFKAEFRLVCDAGGIPLRIEHSLAS